MGKETLTDTFVRLQEKLHLTACNILKDDTEAQDAVQDTFCNLWSARMPDTDDEARFRLFAVLRNVCLNKLKRKRRLVSIDDCDPPAGMQTMDIERTDTERTRLILLASLPPLQRKVFQMCAFDNMEYEEIALRLEISIDAVRMNMSRARKNIRQNYKTLNDENRL